MQNWGGGGKGRSAVTSFATSTYGRELLVGFTNGRVQKYELEGNTLAGRWTQTYPNKVRSVVFVSGTLAAVSRGEGNVALLDRETGDVERLARAAQGYVLSPASAGSLLVGTESNSRVAVWATRTGQLLARFDFTYPVPRRPTGLPGTRSALMTSITSAGHGRVWFATPGAYTARWDLNERRWDTTACRLLQTKPTTANAKALLSPAPCMTDPPESSRVNGGWVGR